MTEEERRALARRHGARVARWATKFWPSGLIGFDGDCLVIMQARTAFHQALRERARSFGQPAKEAK